MTTAPPRAPIPQRTPPAPHGPSGALPPLVPLNPRLSSKVAGARLAAAIAERDGASSAMSALQRRVAEQEREAEGLSAELREARETATAAAAATEASLADSRKVRGCVLECWFCGCFFDPVCLLVFLSVILASAKATAIFIYMCPILFVSVVSTVALGNVKVT